MERLTERSKSKNSSMVWFKDENNNILLEPCEMSSHHSRIAIAKLAAYEDAEEQGLLLRLPCKVGDTVYVVTSPFNVFDDIEYDENMKDEVYEAYVSSVSFYKSGEQYRIYAKATNHFIGQYFQKRDFGKTVFLTKEEAKAKLKKMEEKMDIKYISKEDLMIYWGRNSICIEFPDGSNSLAQENGYTLEQCLEMTDAKFFLD